MLFNLSDLIFLVSWVNVKPKHYLATQPMYTYLPLALTNPLAQNLSALKLKEYTTESTEDAKPAGPGG